MGGMSSQSLLGQSFSAWHSVSLTSECHRSNSFYQLFAKQMYYTFNKYTMQWIIGYRDCILPPFMLQDMPIKSSETVDVMKGILQDLALLRLESFLNPSIFESAQWERGPGHGGVGGVIRYQHQDTVKILILKSFWLIWKCLDSQIRCVISVCLFSLFVRT